MSRPAQPTRLALCLALSLAPLAPGWAEDAPASPPGPAVAPATPARPALERGRPGQAALVDGEGPAQVGDEESTEVAWFRADELPDELSAIQRRRIQCALQDRQDCIFDL